MAVRKLLEAALQTGLGDGVRVVPDPRGVAELGAPMLQLVRTSSKPAPQAPHGSLQSDFDLWLVLPYQDAEAGEDALDDQLDELLVLLESLDWVLWESATRSNYGDAGWIAYKIPVSTIHKMTTKEDL